MKKEAKKPEIVFQKTLHFSGIVMLLLLLGIFFTLLFNSLPSLKAFGLKFITGKKWDPVTGNFAAFPFLVGTLLTSFLALLISIPFSLSVALLLGEYSKGGVLSSFLTGMVELLAGIPSVIYGFWGLFILVPVIRLIELKLGLVPYGVGIFTASLILSVMIIPYSASLGKEVINLVPRDLKEAAYSLGDQVRGDKEGSPALCAFRYICWHPSFPGQGPGGNHGRYHGNRQLPLFAR